MLLPWLKYWQYLSPQGGMIARGIFTLPDFDTNTVRTIITQATPHQAPVMNVDYYMSEYYEKTNSYWISHVNTTLRDVVILSSSGGYRDVMVRSGLSSLHGVSCRYFAGLQCDLTGVNCSGTFNLLMVLNF